MRLHASDRPRERLRSLGARALSTRELLAVLVGSGSGGVGTSLDVADLILRRGSDTLRCIASLDVAALESIPGVGRALATRLIASMELGRRCAAAPAADRPPVIQGPADVHRMFGPELRDLVQEEFHVLLLDARHRVSRRMLVTRGTIDASLIHPREVFREAVAEASSAIILLHNHPSGDPSPSPEDRAVTRQLVEAGRVIGIPVLDHVIVGDGSFQSLSDLGLL